MSLPLRVPVSLSLSLAARAAAAAAGPRRRNGDGDGDVVSLDSDSDSDGDGDGDTDGEQRGDSALARADRADRAAWRAEMARLRAVDGRAPAYHFNSCVVATEVYAQLAAWISELPPRTVVGRVGSVPLTRETLCRLLPKPDGSNVAWLNDEAVNAGFVVAERRARLAGRRTICANTFFSQKVRERSERARAYARMSEWAENDYVLVPVNVPDCHFYLLVLDVANGTVWDWNTCTVASCSDTPRIMAWLRDQTSRTWNLMQVSVPQQLDTWNCGVFTVAYANTAGIGVTPTFRAEDAQTLRKVVLMDLLSFAQ